MSQWKERFLGIEELPEELTQSELEDFFTVAADRKLTSRTD